MKILQNKWGRYLIIVSILAGLGLVLFSLFDVLTEDYWEYLGYLTLSVALLITTDWRSL